MSKSNITRVGIALALGLIGLVVYYFAYEFTYQAKLEREYSSTKSQLEAEQQEGTLKEQEAEQLKQRIQQLEADLQARKAEKVRIASLSQKTVSASSVSVTGTKADWMREAGIPESQWQYVDYIVSKESGWNPNAVNRSSGACGLAQALPCSKMGANWNDPIVALKWQYNYVNARYGGYAGAYQFWLANRWY